MSVAAARVMPGADVAACADLGEGTTVWQLAQVREGARIGRSCTIGRGAYVDRGVVLGDYCKLQNYALVYAPARLGSGVFIGPGAVLANDSYPRAVTGEDRPTTAADWTARGVRIGHGAAVGARSVVLAGVAIGKWAMVGAGAVVTRDVSDYALVTGVPARRVGWVGRDGRPLAADGLEWRCEATGERFREHDGALGVAE